MRAAPLLSWHLQTLPPPKNRTNPNTGTTRHNEARCGFHTTQRCNQFVKGFALWPVAAAPKTHTPDSTIPGCSDKQQHACWCTCKQYTHTHIPPSHPPTHNTLHQNRASLTKHPRRCDGACAAAATAGYCRCLTPGPQPTPAACWPPAAATACCTATAACPQRPQPWAQAG